MPTKPKKQAKLPTRKTKVLAGSVKGKIGQLTFQDMSKLVNLLKGYKGDLPPGYSRKHCHACTCKRP